MPIVTERALKAVASHTHFDHIGCHHEFGGRAVHRAEAGDYDRSMVRLYDLPVRTVHGGHFQSYYAQRHREIFCACLDEQERG